MHIQTPRLDSHEESLFEDWLREAVALRAAIAAWMERSAGHPLSIVFDVPCVPVSDGFHSTPTSMFLDVLRCSERWREIHINIQESRFSESSGKTSFANETLLVLVSAG